ncbi:hypothetical protein LOC68_25515 [Blastopirellula sp. JC732]|uniref:Uncharacterized protein n=1 Tax=Blastopirellula sediminis TaxID=2894196 RepID=A0A9X1SMJ8_9BACT|nr:hypothetical protein [Blastopirellula sediminis]MCC9604931.1 hypothetical protein [Blastopirellula sediminis]MCC9631769.1 hypothetical protein [Blastopirellula sediminis]
MNASESPKRRPPRNYFSRREQVRLFLLSGALTLTFILIYQAAQPSTWQKLFGDEGPPPVAQEEIDTRVPRKAVEDEPMEGAFKVVPPTPFTMNRTGAKVEAGKPAIPEEDLATIQDDSVFRQAEYGAWRQIFYALQKTPDDSLTPAQAEPVQFAQLFRQPDEYRGKLVAVSGTVKRVVKVDASKEDLGVDHLWQIWLFSGADANPMVIYSLELPDQFPTGLKVNERATIVGVFFKRWIYKAEGGIFTAPLLLSKSVAWSPPPQYKPMSMTQLGIGIAVSVVVALVIATLIFRKSNDAESVAERMIRDRQEEKFRSEVGEMDTGVSVRDQLKAVAAQLEQRTSDSKSDESESDETNA